MWPARAVHRLLTSGHSIYCTVHHLEAESLVAEARVNVERRLEIRKAWRLRTPTLPSGGRQALPGRPTPISKAESCLLFTFYAAQSERISCRPVDSKRETCRSRSSSQRASLATIPRTNPIPLRRDDPWKVFAPYPQHCISTELLPHIANHNDTDWIPQGEEGGHRRMPLQRWPAPPWC